jgi:putative DNA primase/helicase
MTIEDQLADAVAQADRARRRANNGTGSNGAGKPPPNVDPDTGEIHDDDDDVDDVLVAFDGCRLTEAGNALRLVDLAAGKLRYVHAWGRWIVYRGGRWCVDEGDTLATELAKKVAKRLLIKAATMPDTDERKGLYKWGIRSESSGAVAAMIRLARGDDRVLTDHADLDADPYVLNVRNGTVDLRTGALREHRPDDLLTMQAPVRFSSDAKAPLWAACLERWQPDSGILEYLQREIGAGTTGIPTETVSIHHGDGGNGKGKFFGAVQAVLGDYSCVPHKSLLVTQRHEQHETVKADLFRVRLAVASETTAVDVLDDEQVKSITGGDLMRARRMREDTWKFWPSHTLIVVTNFRPEIRGRDEGIWRRVRLIPWTVTIEKAEIDINLAAKLRTEAPGILLWMVEGARRFIAEGLDPPDSVTAVTKEYRHDEDTASRFVAECLVFKEKGWTMSVGIAQELERWCREQGIPPMRLKEITPIFTAAGCSTERRTVSGSKSTFWVGVSIIGDTFFGSSEQA